MNESTPNGPATSRWHHLPLGVDPDTVDLTAEISLPRAWTHRWYEAPGAVVAVTADGEQMTAEQLEERSRRIAGRFAAAGLEPGDRLVLSAEGSFDLIVAYVAAHRAGLIVVPVNTAYTAHEVAHVIRNVRPRAAIVQAREMAGWIAAVPDGPQVVCGADVALPDGPAPELDWSTTDTPALICHTSGTTGPAKGAVLTSGNLLASAQALRLAWRWTPADRLALALPLFHLHGLGVGLTGSLVAGASVHLLDRFDADALAAVARSGSVSLFFGVPTMYHRLVEHRQAAAALSSLRLCVSGSAPLTPTIFEGFEQASGHRILERYGMTETVMNVSNLYDGPRKPGTVGVPLPGVQLRLDGGTRGADAAEIQLRGPNVFPGYWQNEAATAEAFTPDGWFRTGDLGELDDDGFLRISGRSKELIISGGFNVHPRDIEDVLRGHPGVADVAVVGEPSDEWGETVVAAVVRSGSLTERELIEYAARRLTAYKRPRIVRFVSTIPRNALGKIVRSELVRPVAAAPPSRN